jgi:signal transduction histidine kinase
MTDMGIIIAIAAALAYCAATVFFCRRYVLNAFDSIEALLDRVLNKERAAGAETTREDRISKLSNKANRILDMRVSEAEQNKTDKETIQGFISFMSNQMKTPLSGISMYADLLLDGNLTADEQREFLSRIKSGTEKLQWMTDALIKMSRLEAGAIRLAPVSCIIRQTLSDAIGSVIAAASKKNICIAVSDFTDVPLYHDRKWTREAIVNVLENAVKYSGPDAEIGIAVEPLTLYTKVIVTDHGPGVEKDEWNAIFKRFYRGRNVKGSEGTGLGLYLAALIMEKQGGYITVDSVPGIYTSFSLFLRNE